MSIFESLDNLRRDYTKDSFNEKTALKNPFEQFKVWFDDAVNYPMMEPNAMALSTVNSEGKPSSRIVLLKRYDENGFVFFTNYESRKGKELEKNPYASLLFYWDRLERQIRIEGITEKISNEESDDYFQSRPYESRLGAWASKQSEVLPSRFTLIREVAKLLVKYPAKVPLPPFWGGYRLKPDVFEFWQGRPSRLHDRIRYSKRGELWVIERLYP
ncbi:MAG: pyridoxamine 5'-phosphate oxidase [Candidatus Kapabacteria bacterium]|nr:pyridoxamine 5'-phosphate oxidase [Candidatus Kapabacteria bacterium]